jgi:hypothetical protein
VCYTGNPVCKKGEGRKEGKKEGRKEGGKEGGEEKEGKKEKERRKERKKTILLDFAGERNLCIGQAVCDWRLSC